MKFTPALLGVFLALTFTTTLVASQQACESSDECPDNTYCNANKKTCLVIGECVDLADCSDPTNAPYFLLKCLGTMFCDETCQMDCGTTPEDDKGKNVSGSDESVSTTRDDNENETMESRSKCESHSDCKGFCASDGICEEIGGCAVVDDCDLEVNQGYGRAPCMGNMECNDRACAMNCSGGSDAMFGCRSSEECFEPGEYCTTDEICRPSGICFADADCSLPDNKFSAIECVGRFFCENNKCDKECGDFPEDPVETTTCTTSADCEKEEEYCAGNGTCLGFGGCDREGDCVNADNEFMMIACVGTVTCGDGMCGKTCDSGDIIDEKITSEIDTTKEDGSAVSIKVSQCKSDSDCISITTSTTRAAVLDSYCAHGVCTKHSSCFTDEDCINPSNLLFKDNECIGHLRCTEMGMCDRVCGEECKNGSTSVQCFANPCDTQPLCDGAVSCAMTTCDGACNALFYTADGEEFSCGSVVMPWDDNTKDGSSSSGDTKGETTTDSDNLDSSAVFRGTSSYVLLVALLAAAVFV